MTFDETTAAYGFFQVVFADLIEHLAAAAYFLRKQIQPDLTFDAIFRQDSAKILKQLRRELRQFEERSAHGDSATELLDVCNIVAELLVWRNDRIHARVRLGDNGYILYDWRTGRRLQISRDEIVKHTQRAVRAMVSLEGHIRFLAGLLRFSKEFDELFGTLPDD